MSKANSRFKAVTWRQIQEWARQDGAKGLPTDGDRVQCFKRRIPVGDRQICFMRLVRGPVKGIVIVLAAIAHEANNGKLRAMPPFTRKEVLGLFIKASATMKLLREREGDARQAAESSSVFMEPSPFEAKAPVGKKQPKRRSARVRFRAARMRVAG